MSIFTEKLVNKIGNYEDDNRVEVKGEAVWDIMSHLIGNTCCAEFEIKG